MPARSQPKPADLNRTLAGIQRQLKRQNSFPLAFLRGVVAGLGATLGATVFLTLLVFVILAIARLLGLESAAQSLLESIR